MLSAKEAAKKGLFRSGRETIGIALVKVNKEEPISSRFLRMANGYHHIYLGNLLRRYYLGHPIPRPLKRPRLGSKNLATLAPNTRGQRTNPPA